MRYLKPSAEFRDIFQYNNLMYETLSYLPQVLLNQTYESYVAQHLFIPLNMSASTFSVAEAEARGTLADGYLRDMQDLTKGINGTLTPIVPYFQRPGEENIWAGAGGVLTSARDLVHLSEEYKLSVIDDVVDRLSGYRCC
jgi:CubicO group peptidase (beta-lactamase class C family)